MSKRTIFLAALGIVAMVGLLFSLGTQSSSVDAYYDSEHNKAVSDEIQARLYSYAEQIENRQTPKLLTSEALLGEMPWQKICIYGPYGITDNSLPVELKQWKNIDQWNMENISKEAKWQMFIVQKENIIPVSLSRKIIDMTDPKRKDLFPNTCYENPVFSFTPPQNHYAKSSLKIAAHS